MPSLLRRLACGTFFLLLATSSPRTAHAASLAEYRSLISECRRVVEQSKPSDRSLQNLRSRLSYIDTVTYPGGDTVTVNTEPLIAALRQSTGDDLVVERFAALEGLLSAAEKAPSKSGDPQQLAAQVMADEEFDALRKTAKPVKTVTPNWWTRFTSWLRETAERISQWLNNLFRDRPSPTAPNLPGVRAFVKFLQFVLYFALAAGALVALYLLARNASVRVWLAGLRKRRRRGSDSDLDLDLSGDGIADPLAEARSLAAQGAYREAVRMAYIASLRRLQESGLLVLESNKTNWEYQRDLRRRSREASNALLPATRLFDRVWYGRRASTAEEFAEAVRVHNALQGLREPADSAETVNAKGGSE